MPNSCCRTQPPVRSANCPMSPTRSQGHRPTRWVLANVPNLMILDDHDIRSLSCTERRTTNAMLGTKPDERCDFGALFRFCNSMLHFVMLSIAWVPVFQVTTGETDPRTRNSNLLTGRQDFQQADDSLAGSAQTKERLRRPLERSSQRPKKKLPALVTLVLAL